jgi:DNA-binding MarR family transcriptional regulator
MSYEQLKLKNQICFPVYAASRLIIREYQPYLDELGITYPQYLVMMVLWENDEIPVNDIAKSLILNTNTITPLLKRMEQMDLIQRERSTADERKVIVRLTDKGRHMEQPACDIPAKLIAGLKSDNMDINEILDLKEKLYKIISLLSDEEIKSL